MTRTTQRPDFETGLRGRIYTVCYPEPKTGYQIAEALDLHHSQPYQCKSRHPALFDNHEDGMFAAIDPLVARITTDLVEADLELTPGEEDSLRAFLDSDWRDAIGTIDDIVGETPITVGVYSTFLFAIRMTEVIQPGLPNDIPDNTTLEDFEDTSATVFALITPIRQLNADVFEKFTILLQGAPFLRESLLLMEALEPAFQHYWETIDNLAEELQECVDERASLRDELAKQGGKRVNVVHPVDEQDESSTRS